MQEYALLYPQTYSPCYTKLLKCSVIEILKSTSSGKKLQRLSISLLFINRYSRDSKYATKYLPRYSRIHKYLSSLHDLSRFFINYDYWSFGIIEIKNQKSFDPRDVHSIAVRESIDALCNNKSSGFRNKSSDRIFYNNATIISGLYRCSRRNRMLSRPPIQNLAEPRLNSSAQFSFSRRRLSRRSLTSRVNYGLRYQPARRLDAVGRVKIQGGPIGAGWSIGYRGTANEKITCLALSGRA